MLDDFIEQPHFHVPADGSETFFDGNNGEKIRREAIPAEMQEEAKKYRHAMLESLSMYSDDLMELLLGEAEVPVDLIHATVRDAVRSSARPSHEVESDAL